MKLYPYLAKDGLYGYADTQLRLQIPAQYKSASTFTATGYAVVTDEQHRYGVIDKKGALVVPFNYKTVQLQVAGTHTLAWTERIYRNSFRFWEWQFLPGFWSPSDKRLFDTKVDRSHLRITVLESGQQIYSKRTPSGGGSYFRVEPLDGTHFLRDGILYGSDAKRFRVLARNIFGQLDGGLLLQRKGTHYRLLNREGKPAAGSRFLYRDSLQYEVDGEKHLTNLVLKDGHRNRVADVFRDEQDRQYVFPDFSKAFPSRIASQVHQGLAADTLIRKAALISGIPGTDRFIFRWFDRSSDSFAHWMLDTAGNWRQDVPENNTFSIATRGVGHILWPAISTVIPADAVEQGWRLANYSKIGENSPLYTVTIRREKEERMGVWDAEGKKWAWQPLNAAIRCLDPKKGYWTFKPEKEGKYGLYHLPTQRELIPPKYHDMNGSGMVSYYDDLRKYTRFYVDWDTQIEYRDK